MENKTKRRLRNIDLNIPTTATGVEGVLAGETGHGISQWLASTFNKNFDAYDTAIDSVYNDLHIGGSRYHHLLDGQHDIWGAFGAVDNVNADDGWLTELTQASEHLLRDTMSVSGVNPFFSLSPTEFDILGGLVSNLGISKTLLADALTFNGAELLGGTIATLSSVTMARKKDISKLSRVAGGCLLSSVVSANPLLLPIAAAGMAYATYRSEDKKQVFVSAGKGALVSGSALMVSSLIGGPVWVGCITGMVAAVAMSKAIGGAEKHLERAKDIMKPATLIFKQAGEQVAVLQLEEA